MSHGCANAIVSSIATTNDDNVFTFSVYVTAIGEFRVKEGFRIQLEKY